MIHSSLIPYQNQPPYTLWCNWCTVYNTRVCYTIICLRKCVWECPWAPLHPTLPYFTTKFWCLNCPSVYPKVADFSTQFYTITRVEVVVDESTTAQPPGKSGTIPAINTHSPSPRHRNFLTFILFSCSHFVQLFLVLFFTYISTFLINLFFACQSRPLSRNKPLHWS